MFDFTTITSVSDAYNLHTHTQFCDGRATMEDFVKAAIAEGFTHLGFSPHSPIIVESPCNMKREAVGLYLDEIMRLRAKYGHQIKLLASMEIDYLGVDFGPAHIYFQSLPLNYRIGSVHFIPNQNGEYVDIDGRYASFEKKMHEHFNDDIEYVVNTFFNQSEAMVRAGGFNIIGHLNKVAHNASHFRQGIDCEPWFEQRVRKLIELVAEKGLTVEINTKAYADHHRFFPDPKWWPLLKQLNVPIVVNSDAHRTELINASRLYALTRLHQL